MSVVYLLHFEKPIAEGRPTQHYIGFAKDLDRRLAHHRHGTSGARLLEVAFERGIGFVVARVWDPGDKVLERQLKDQKNGRRLCPICTPEEKDGRTKG